MAFLKNTARDASRRSVRRRKALHEIATLKDDQKVVIKDAKGKPFVATGAKLKQLAGI